MSVNNRRQDTGFASFIRAPPNLRRYAQPPQLYLDIPPTAPTQLPIQYSHAVRPAYRLPLQPLTHNTLPRGQQHYHAARMADQDFKMDFMFDDQYFDDNTSLLSASKQSPALPMCPQAMPANFSFRPWHPSNDANTPVSVQHDTFPTMKIESTPDLPTPAVLSTSVDVSQYENVQHHEWLEGVPDYTGISPASADMCDSSSSSEDVEAFEDNATGYRLSSWTQAHPHNLQFGRLRSIAPSITDGSCASPAPSYDGFKHQPGAASWGTSMFGQPDIVPPSRFYRTQHPFQPVINTPQATQRPESQQSDRQPSIVPSMDSRHAVVEDEAYVKRRDKMLVDLRDKGHSYKDIKRIGRFTEAESTLRGRLRTLTKEKSERVRKPKWNARDIELLSEAVEYFMAEPAKSSRRRKSFRKLPWKKISQWMKDQGSSYLFAPATCAKKWEEI